MKSTNSEIIEYDAIIIKPMEDEMPQVNFETENEESFSYKCGEIFLQQSRVLCFVCTLCEKHFRNLYAFTRHLDDHTDMQYNIKSEAKGKEVSKHVGEDLIGFRLSADSVQTNAGTPIVPPKILKAMEIEKEEILELEEADLIEYSLLEDSVETDAPIIPPERRKTKQTESIEISLLDEEDLIEYSPINDSIDTITGSSKISLETREAKWKETYENVKHMEGELIVLRLQDDSTVADVLTTPLESNKRKMPKEDLIEIRLQHNSIDVDVSTKERERPCSTLTILTTPSSEYSSDEESIGSKYDCKLCAGKFNLAKDLRQHKCIALKTAMVAASSSTTPIIYPCTVCGKIFNRKWNLRTHSYSHTKNKPFKCDRCPATYANKQNLTVHQRRHNGDKPFSCDYCSRSFVSSTERISHMRTHTGEKPYVCEDCGRGHSTSSQLLEHSRRAHLDVRNYECLDCGKAFRTSSHFRSHHEAVHQKLPRNHKCNVCKSAFKTAAALQAHSKIHKEKLYKCKICDKTFAQHPGLYMHKAIHKKMKPIH